MYPVLGIGWVVRSPDDVVLKLLSNTGIVGLIAFGWFLKTLYSHLRACMTVLSPPGGPIGAHLLGMYPLGSHIFVVSNQRNFRIFLRFWPYLVRFWHGAGDPTISTCCRILPRCCDSSLRLQSILLAVAHDPGRGVTDMRVLLITRTLAEFGNLQGKIREIAKLNVDLTVVSPPRWAGRDHELQQVRPDGYELLIRNCVFSSTTSVQLGNHLHFYPGISRLIRDRKWDLVHIDEEPFNFATFHALRACRRHRVPAIFTTWQNLMKNYPPPFDHFEKYAFQHASGAIAGNEDGAKNLRLRGFNKPLVRVPRTWC